MGRFVFSRKSTDYLASMQILIQFTTPTAKKVYILCNTEYLLHKKQQ
jgi:hypothetical protein